MRNTGYKPSGTNCQDKVLPDIIGFTPDTTGSIVGFDHEIPSPDINDRIYISGPMSSLPREQCIRRFMMAERVLRRLGYRNICNPCRVWSCRWPWLYRIIGYRLTLLYDLWLLTHCRFIYKMPGWRTSRGCQMESCVAFHFGIFTVSRTIREAIDNSISKRNENHRTI